VDSRSASPGTFRLNPRPGAFALAQGKTVANVYVDSSDWPGVIRAAGDLEGDIARVTGAAASSYN
jgi:hypothetical protein